MEIVKRISETEIEVDGLVYKREQPEFKVGQWATWYLMGDTKILRITRLDGDRLWFEENGKEGNCFIRNCRPALRSEIKEHLINIFDKKGFKMGAKYRDPQGNLVNIVKVPTFTYIEIDDILGIDGISPHCHDIVYQKGKFAEIIPSLKKKPENREEFVTFIINYENRTLYMTMDEFLNQYEI